MNIDFDNIEEKRYPAFKGGDGTLVAKMYVDDSIRIINGYLEPNSSIGSHTHDDSSETVYIISGSGKMVCDNEEEILTAGSCSYCPKGHTHTLINTSTEPLRFVGVVPNL
ncbi:MAG: cupin domain-containing protein [Lachnospiraceae bacterium]|nr:cupin domain-containing protein [Candidatus Colinaster equi]